VYHQVLCGKVPYWEISRGAAAIYAIIMERRLPGKPEAAGSLGFTDELWSMAECCWQRNRDERPEAKEIVDCLESAAQAWDTRPLPLTDADS